MAFVGHGNAHADDRIPVAVSYFHNTSGKPEIEPLKKGLAEMLITDLSVAKEIRLVERARLNELMKELALQTSVYVDKRSAAKLGRGLGAALIIVGSYLVQGDVIRIDARMVDVETSDVVLSVKHEGQIRDFFALQRGLAEQLLHGIGASLSILQKKRLGQTSTRNYTAFKRYASGLDHLDRGDDVAAQQALEDAIRSDPEFKAARALREKIAAQARAIDLSAQERLIRMVADYRAKVACTAAAAPPIAPGYYAPKVPIALSKLGFHPEAIALMKQLVTPEFLGDAGSASGNRCASYQVMSWLYFQNLEFEKAMTWQVKASQADTGFQFHSQCMQGMYLLSLGLTFERTPKVLIQEAIENPATFERLKTAKAARERMRRAADGKLKELSAGVTCEK